MNQDKNRIILQNVVAEDLKDIFNKTLEIDMKDIEIKNVITLLNLLKDKDEHIETFIATPSLPEGMIGMMLLKTYYNINIKRTTFIITAAILDALMTRGLLTAFLSLLGVVKQAIGKINPKEGEYCVLLKAKHLKDNKFDINPKMVYSNMKDNECMIPKISCKFMKDNSCEITEFFANKIFSSLEEKGAIEKDGDNWKLPL